MERTSTARSWSGTHRSGPNCLPNNGSPAAIAAVSWEQGVIMSAQEPIRVLTVDDHALLRNGIRRLIGAEADMQLVAEASTGREAVEQFRTHRPDITLMDLQMPDMNGIEAIIAIRGDFPEARIIVLSTYSGDVQWSAP